MKTETMKEIKIYNSKVRLLFSISVLTTLLLTITFNFSNLSNNKYINLLFCILLTAAIIFNLRRLIKPKIVIDSAKITFPLSNEFVYWENIDKIEFNNIENTLGSIEIKVKEIDRKRKKCNLPHVFDDYDDNGYPDFSLYRLDLECLRINNEQLYKTILDLSQKSKAEREIQISGTEDEAITTSNGFESGRF